MTDKPKPLDLSIFNGHTPGPWSAHAGDPDEGHDCYEIRRAGEYIASVAWQLRTDAALIAAAPDLLAEVKRLRAENEALKKFEPNCILDNDGAAKAAKLVEHFNYRFDGAGQ